MKNINGYILLLIFLVSVHLLFLIIFSVEKFLIKNYLKRQIYMAEKFSEDIFSSKEVNNANIVDFPINTIENQISSKSFIDCA